MTGKTARPKDAKSAKGVKAGDLVIATNRKARYNFDIEDTIEAGISLVGSEVKSLRRGRASLADAYARIRDGELYLEQLHIPIYEEASYQNHEPLRSRKLLVHASQIRELRSATERDGYTLVPMKLYFKGNKVKIAIAIAKGRKQHDKRQAVAERDAKRWMEKASAARRRA